MTEVVGVSLGVTAPQAPAGLPLCVDLDGTLLAIDSLQETVVDAVRRDWRVLFRLPGWLLQGRAMLKRHLADAAPVDPALLPYNHDFLDWLKEERRSGRSLILATASDRRTAEAVAAHLGIFDAVIATDGENNLKGAAKADQLCKHFGERGFAYAGNDRADLAVWPRAGGAVVVRANAGVTRRARAMTQVEREFPRKGNRLLLLARAMRLYQWVKNLLVFAAPAAAHQLLVPDILADSLLMFLSFGLTASGIYLMNDVADLPSDRQHPRKRLRPFASGALPVMAGLIGGPALVLLGLLIAAGLGASSLVVLISYAIISTAYSLGLKKLPLVDVFILAGLYTIRIVAGGMATNIFVSHWLLSASGFFFLGLAFLKRFVELNQMDDGASNAGSRRGYGSGDTQVLMMMGVSSGFIACLVLALYVSSEPAIQYYAQPGLLWGVVPLACFWICRLWLSGLRGYVHDDPIVYAAKDWVSRCVLVASALLAIGASVGLGR